jgi:hypothetical protein
MDDCVDFLARAAQCRRLAFGLVDEPTVQVLRDLAKELEDRAARTVTAPLAGVESSEEGGATHRYAVFRVDGGWLVSRNGDRMAVRATLADARSEAARLAGFDTWP